MLQLTEAIKKLLEEEGIKAQKISVEALTNAVVIEVLGSDGHYMKMPYEVLQKLGEAVKARVGEGITVLYDITR